MRDKKAQREELALELGQIKKEFIFRVRNCNKGRIEPRCVLS